MKMQDKLDKLIDGQAEQNVTLGRMQVDIAHHIKRSDAHELHLKEQDKKIQKIWYFIIAGASAGAAEYGTTIFKWLGKLI